MICAYGSLHPTVRPSANNLNLTNQKINNIELMENEGKKPLLQSCHGLTVPGARKQRAPQTLKNNISKSGKIRGMAR
jgi:hypothetical protein